MRDRRIMRLVQLGVDGNKFVYDKKLQTVPPVLHNANDHGQTANSRVRTNARRGGLYCFLGLFLLWPGVTRASEPLFLCGLELWCLLFESRDMNPQRNNYPRCAKQIA